MCHPHSERFSRPPLDVVRRFKSRLAVLSSASRPLTHSPDVEGEKSPSPTPPPRANGGNNFGLLLFRAWPCVPTNVLHLRWYPWFVSLIPPILSRFSCIHMSRKQRRVRRNGTGGLAKKMFEFLALITRWEKRERGARKWHSYATTFVWIAAPRSKFKNRVSFRRSHPKRRSRRRSLLPRKLACLGNSPSLSHPQTSGGGRSPWRAAGNCAFWRSFRPLPAPRGGGGPSSTLFR